MKRKIVIGVPMHNDMCRSKAMQAAVSMDGVISVDTKPEMNEMVLTGDGVDPVRLTNLLRRKLDYAKLVTVEEVKPPEEKPVEAQPDAAEAQPDAAIQWQPYYCYPYTCPQHCICCNVSYADPANWCFM